MSDTHASCLMPLAFPPGMPELPEVESVRRQLHEAIVGRVITRAELRRPDYLTVITGDVPPKSFPRLRCSPPQDPRLKTQDPSHHLLEHHRITTTSRKGKQLAIHTEQGPILLLQLGMSGEVQICTPPASPDPNLHFADLPFAISPHTHALWHLDNHTTVHFTDPRRFGHLTWFASLESLHQHRWNLLGPDALTITPDQLAEAFASTTRQIKAALLDQSLLAGVGNIYADEALHRAAIHPKRPARRLTTPETARLAHAITTTLAAAVHAGGSTISTYRSPAGTPGNHQDSHRVYARAGLPCLNCDTPLRAETIAQRTTTWCPTCQPYRRQPEAAPQKPTIHTRFTSAVQTSRSPSTGRKSTPPRRGVHSS